MKLETIDSTAIHAIGYDPDLHVLEVIFNTGRIYQFTDVPPEQFEALRQAESKGRYFSEHIRDTYPYWSFHVPGAWRRRVKGVTR